MGNSIKELVNAFNVSNYFCDRVNTNFTVDGQKIVGLFAYGTDVGEYLRRIGEEIIKQQYLGSEVVAGKYYNLNCFPFVLGANPSKKESDIEGVMRVELADSANKEVIRNLKIHLVNEFRRAVTLKVIARLVEEARITEEEGHEWVGGAVRIGVFDGSNPLRKDYLYCIAFDGEYFEREGYDSETFELFKGMYIQEFNSRLEKCGLKNSDFYHYKDDMLYIRNVKEEVVENVAKYDRERVAFDFRTPGKEDSKVENFKAVLSNLISKWVGKSICSYDYDVFTNEKEIGNGNSFVLIPLTEVSDNQFESLKCKDAYTINAIHKGFIRDIRGETEKLYIAHCKNQVYGISNKKIAKVLPEIMQSPIAYNKRTGHFEFAADLGPSSSVRSPRHVSSVSLPVLLPQLQPGTEGTVVAVPAADAKNNPGPSMSGQNPDDGYDYMQDSSQSVNTRDPSDAERIRKRRNSDGRNLSADSALSSEFDASRSPNAMGMTDDSGVYSSQELPTSDPEGPIGPLPVRVMGNPQNPSYTCVMESCQDSSEFDTMESDGKHKLDRSCPSRASSGSTLSFSSSTSDTSVATVTGVEDSSSESSPLRSASSEPPATPSSSIKYTNVAKLLAFGVGVFK